MILALSSIIFVFVLSFFGKHHWVLDLLAHFRSHLFFACLLLSIVSLVLKRKKMLIASMFSSLMIFLASSSNWLERPTLEYPKPAHAHISFMTFNVWKDNDRFYQTIDYIRNHQPDVVGLIEVSPIFDQELQQLKDLYPYYTSLPEEGRFGLALMSKLPFKSARQFELYRFIEPVIAVEVYPNGIHNKAFHLLLFHPRPPINAAFTECRNHDFDSLSLWLHTKGRDPILVMGDFNATIWSTALQNLIQEHDLKTGAGLWRGGTWPSVLGILGIQIDHIMVKNMMTSYSQSIGPNLGSDHRPVHALIAVD